MPPLTVRSIQWPHWSGDARLSEALRLTRYAAPDACAVIGGDFHSPPPDIQTHPAQIAAPTTPPPPLQPPHKLPPPGPPSPPPLRAPPPPPTTPAPRQPR